MGADRTVGRQPHLRPVHETDGAGGRPACHFGRRRDDRGEAMLQQERATDYGENRREGGKGEPGLKRSRSLSWCLIGARHPLGSAPDMLRPLEGSLMPRISAPPSLKLGALLRGESAAETHHPRVRLLRNPFGAALEEHQARSRRRRRWVSALVICFSTPFTLRPILVAIWA